MNKTKLVLILIALTLLITGCSTKDSTKTTTNTGKGRYMEGAVALPENISSEATLQLKKINGMPCLYVYTPEEYCTITRYLMQEDGTWTEDTPAWLNTVKQSPDYIYQNNIFEDAKGNQYFYFLETEGDILKGKLLRSSDGETYETLSPEGWDEKDEEYGIYYYPQTVNVLKDGTLIALCYDGEITFYNAETLKKENSITGSNYLSTILSVSDKSIIVGQADSDNYTFLGVDVYDSTDTHEKQSYPFTVTLDSYHYLDVNDKSDLLLCNADGIHILENGTSLWQTIVDGTLTSLSMGTMWSNGFIAGTDDTYYVLYNSEQGYQLMEYSFDETVDTVPSTELTIYALQDNSTLRQAASVFQQSHPDVKVSFLIAMSADEYAEATDAVKADYIKALNTELLAGNGSDLLVLDDLPVDSLIEKGILSDLSDVIQPMIDNDELYENIVMHYFTDQKIYSVPARFNLPLLLSSDIDASGIASLESLAAYVKEHPDQNLFGMSSVVDFIDTYSPFLSSKILDTDGSINRENLITVLSQIKDISTGYKLVDSYPEDAFRADGTWELASRVKLSTNTCSGFLDSMFPLGIMTYVNGSFVPFDQSVIPSCEIGINHNSDKQELCKEFLELVLSKEIGMNDFYDGFSMNKEALLLCSVIDRSDYAAASEIENADGSYSPITFGKLSDEQTQRLVQACTDAANIASTDVQIINALKEVAKDLLDGTKSVEEAADYIIENTKIYLSE